LIFYCVVYLADKRKYLAIAFWRPLGARPGAMARCARVTIYAHMVWCGCQGRHAGEAPPYKREPTTHPIFFCFSQKYFGISKMDIFKMSILQIPKIVSRNACFVTEKILMLCCFSMGAICCKHNFF